MYNGRDGVVTDDNGLIYMRARYYSPELRRFVNADIIAGKITNAITLNRYAYANGNPVSNVDPFGLSAERGEKCNWWNDVKDWFDGVMETVSNWQNSAEIWLGDITHTVCAWQNSVTDWSNGIADWWDNFDGEDLQDVLGEWTFSTGLNFSAYLFAGSTYSYTLAVDSSGNLAIQKSTADVFKKGITLGIASLGVSRSYSFTTFDSIEDLNGVGYSTGLSLGKGNGAGGIALTTTPDFDVVGGGISFGLGVGFPIDINFSASDTETKYQTNIIDSLKNIFHR